MSGTEVLFGQCSPALREELESFIKHCRARLQPEDVGLGRVGRRRVPGLRREEVAELIGVSTRWYRLFENGTSHAVSFRFLCAVSDTLRLTDHERRYLFALCNVPADVNDRTEPLDERIESIFETPHETPFALLDESLTVVGYNPLYARLRELPDRPVRRDPWNLAAWVFESKMARRIYVDWEQKAEAVCSVLRMNLARNFTIAQRRVTRLRRLPEFELRWNRFGVMDLADADVDIAFRHPAAGVINTRLTTLGHRNNHYHLVVQNPSDEDSRERLHWLSTQ